MVEICNNIIDHPSAWTPRTLDKEKMTARLTENQLRAIDSLLEQTRHLPPQSISREQFDHPDLSPFLAAVLNTLQNGRGVVLIAGITHDRYSEDDFERVFWGIGTHLGTAVIQSPDGDRLGHVRYVPRGEGNRAGRAYRGNDELHMHVDTQEIVGLMCVQKAKSGGYSALISSLALHNEILRTRPDLLPPLYEGFYFATNEALLTDNPLTPYKVPVFCYVDGKLSCALKMGPVASAAKLLGGLPEDLAEAMDYVKKLTTSDDLRLTFMLEPGEMLIWNNFTNLHARTAFEDYDEPERKRHLLRLWLDAPEEVARPVIPVFHEDLVAGTASYARAKAAALT